MLVAAEILSTGWCPFDCGYCYIPKSDVMKEIHEEIIQSLKDGSYVETLKSVYGKQLEFIGLWGTEPALTIKYFIRLLPTIKRAFPRLKGIMFSTSLMSHPEEFAKLALALEANNMRVTLKIQVSIDGPAWITDRNRMPGAAETIPQNIVKLVTLLQPLRWLRVRFLWKVTHSLENMKAFLRKPSRVEEFLGYFNLIEKKFNRANNRSHITFQPDSYLPSLVVPGKYTTRDGKLFARYIKLLNSKGFYTTYRFRLKRIFDTWNQLERKHILTCSGGDSNLGISNNGIVHICHRTYYLNDKRYIDSILHGEDEKNWDVALFKRGNIDSVSRTLVVPKSDLTRFLYVLRGHHDFWKFQIGAIVAMLKELALVEQIDREYADNEELAILVAIFLISGMGCSMENVLNTGSIHLQTISQLRLLCNGAFKHILKEVIKDVLPTVKR